MTATLNFQIRDHMRELYPEHRLGVLTLLMLHCDVRNRCWPSVDLLAHEMKLSPSRVSKAKQWLLAQGAIELVPYDKRVGDELKLPSRQHVYQLTGKIKIGDKIVPYLYFQAPIAVPELNPSDAGNFKVSDASNTSIDNTSIGRGSINPSEVFPSKDENTTSEPVVQDVPPKPKKESKPRKRDILFDAIALGSFHLEKVPDNLGGRIAAVKRDFLSVCFPDSKPTAEQIEKVAADVAAMYVWYKKTHTGDLPAGAITINKYLVEYRAAKAPPILNLVPVEHEDWVAIKEAS